MSSFVSHENTIYHQNNYINILKSDWKKQIQQSIKTLDELIHFFGKSNIKNSPYSYILSSDYKKIFNNIHHLFRFQVTHYYLNLANINNPQCPILLQILPNERELQDPYFHDLDPLREESNSPIPNLVHRYPDRVLWYISHHCAVYCRFCMRKRKVSNPISNTLKKNKEIILEYIKNHKDIKEVILSGGDPLSLEDHLFDEILKELKQIQHIYSIRIHTRMITMLPARITRNLVQIFEKYYPLTLVTHFNHSLELTDIVFEKIKMLKKAGVMVLNQSVLLKHINDSSEEQEKLILKLIQFGIKPYYLHHCDEVKGTSHFRITLKRGIEILQSLRGRNPGIALPSYMIDLPNGGGKVPVQPSYLFTFNESQNEYEFYNYKFDKLYTLKEIYEE